MGKYVKTTKVSNGKQIMKPKLTIELNNFVVQQELNIILLGVYKAAVWSSGKSAGLVTNMISVQNPLMPFCCVLGKDTLQHIPLLSGPGKQL